MKSLASLKYILLISLCSFLLALPALADTAIWVDGIVINEEGRVVKNANVVVHEPDGTLVDEVRTDKRGHFNVSYLSIKNKPYQVVIKKSGDTHRFDMRIDDTGYEGNQAFLFLFSDENSIVRSLEDGLLYRWRGVYSTDTKTTTYFSASLTESDSPFFELYSYSFGLNKHRKLTKLTSKVNTVNDETIAISPNGQYIATVFDNPIYSEGKKRIEIWDIQNVERELKRNIGDKKYFSEYNGEVFAGAQEYDLDWMDNRCVKTSIYEDPASDEDFSHKTFVEKRTYCL